MLFEPLSRTPMRRLVVPVPWRGHPVIVVLHLHLEFRVQLCECEYRRPLVQVLLPVVLAGPSPRVLPSPECITSHSIQDEALAPTASLIVNS